MGTSANIIVNDEDGKHLVEMYTSCDGFMENIGEPLREIASKNLGVSVEGIAGIIVKCFADPQYFYIIPPSELRAGEYIYKIYPGNDKLLQMEVSWGKGIIYKGAAANFHLETAEKFFDEDGD